MRFRFVIFMGNDSSMLMGNRLMIEKEIIGMKLFFKEMFVFVKRNVIEDLVIFENFEKEDIMMRFNCLIWRLLIGLVIINLDCICICI